MEGTYIFSQKSRHNDLTSMIMFFCPRKFWICNVYKSLYSQSYGSHEQMWELDHKEVWALKNWCFWIVVLEKTLASPSGLQGDQIAKSLQSRPTLCDPIDGSPPGSPIPGIIQARTLEWVAISFSGDQISQS